MTNATMADIGHMFGLGVLNRPVVDQTGLTGKFDLRLTDARWTAPGDGERRRPARFLHCDPGAVRVEASNGQSPS